MVTHVHFPEKAWLRLEPRSRGNEIEDGLAARIADPLWMLARQWQTGEFQGEDAGSPIFVQTDYSTYRPTKLYLGNESTAENLGDEPLEPRVEQEYLHTDWSEMDWRTSIRVGQKFEGLLKQVNPQAIPALRDEFPITPSDAEADIDEASRQFVSFMVGRAVNGRQLLDWIDKTPQSSDNWNVLASKLNITSSPQLEKLIKSLRDWCESLNIKRRVDNPEAWRNQQLDYRFSLGNDNDKFLVAPSYQSGELDWYSFHAFDRVPEKYWTKQPSIVMMPARLRIRGTALRWWEFEDAVTHFGNIDANSDDLAKILLIEFVMGYADDWFSVSVPAEIPNLVRIDKITVKNVFGEISSGADDGFVPAFVPDPDPLRRWEMFSLSPTKIENNVKYPGIADTSIPGVGTYDDEYRVSLLFLPPLGGEREESPALEEIRFLRDEGANMVWSVEHTVLNALGKPVHGYDAQRERAARQRQVRIRELEAQLAGKLKELEALPLDMGPQRLKLEADIKLIRDQISRLKGEAPDSYSEVPLYRLASTVPDNWVPFLPVNINKGSPLVSIQLHRAHMLRNNETETTEAIPVQTHLLNREDKPGALMRIEESAIPRSGRRLVLTAQRLRGVDGKTYVWLGRKVLTGRGEGSSGLRFDFLFNTRS